MSVAPEILDCHRELAAQALDGISWQTAAAARFLMQGDDRQAVAAYRRAVALIKDYASPDMRVIASAMAVEGAETPSTQVERTEGVVTTSPSPENAEAAA